MNLLHKQQRSIVFLSAFIRTLTVAFALGALTSCASPGTSNRTRISPLPVTVVHAGSGTVTRVLAQETSGRLYVSGQVKQSHGYHLPAAAHVDIKLLGAGGRILAEKQEDIDLTAHARTSAARSRASSYATSFPMSQARQAVGIQVTYHPYQHPDEAAPDLNSHH